MPSNRCCKVLDGAQFLTYFSHVWIMTLYIPIHTNNVFSVFSTCSEMFLSPSKKNTKSPPNLPASPAHGKPLGTPCTESLCDGGYLKPSLGLCGSGWAEFLTQELWLWWQLLIFKEEQIETLNEHHLSTHETLRISMTNPLSTVLGTRLKLGPRRSRQLFQRGHVLFIGFRINNSRSIWGLSMDGDIQNGWFIKKKSHSTGGWLGGPPFQDTTIHRQSETDHQPVNSTAGRWNCCHFAQLLCSVSLPASARSSAAKWRDIPRHTRRSWRSHPALQHFGAAGHLSRTGGPWPPSNGIARDTLAPRGNTLRRHLYNRTS